MAIADRAAFIAANTRLQAVPPAPEISLWLADEVTPIWRLTEEELGEMGLPPPFWAFAWAGGQGLARWLLDIRMRSLESGWSTSRRARAWSASPR